MRWPLALRLIYAAFFIAVLAICTFFIWMDLANDENVPLVLWGFAIPLLALSSYGALFWRVRSEYNETTPIAYPMAGKPRQFALSDLTRVGPVSWRGHEFSTEAGDKVYVNSLQTGAPALIGLLQGLVKEVYFE